MVAKLRFSLFLSTALGLAISVSPAFCMDDLMLDMGLDVEESEFSAPQNSTSAPAETSHVSAPAAQPLPAPTAAPKVTPPPAPKKAIRPKKNIASGIDLLTRIKKGMDFNTEEVEEWVMSGNDINQCMENGKTLLLYLSALHDDTEAINFLINNGAEIQTHCTPRYEALFVAVKENNSVPVIETLINNNANIVDTDEDGNTALILAAAYNTNPQIINTLLEYGLKIDTKNHFGFDALTMAVYNNGRLPMIQNLLDNGANINARDNNGRTPLMAAAVLGNDMIMQYLIKQGADYNATDNQGISVLDYYNKRTYPNTHPFELNPYASPAEKLSQSYNFIAENHLKYNNALLQSLYQENTEDAIAEALTNNADVDILDAKGCTPLLNAAMLNKSVMAIETLVNGKADVNAACQNGKTALMFTSGLADSATPLTEQVEKIRLLTNKGANPNAKDENGNTALMYAAANNAAPGIIQTLTNAEANINAVNNAGETALMVALKHQADEKTILSLLENGADPNIADNSSLTPLWQVITSDGKPTVLATLLRYGANTEIPNAAGELPIWYILTKSTNEETIVQLVSGVKNTNTPNQTGDTPLLFSLKNNYPATVIQALLENGADPKIRDKNGNDAYDILKNNQYFNEAMKKRTREHVLDEWN